MTFNLKTLLVVLAVLLISFVIYMNTGAGVSVRKLLGVQSAGTPPATAMTAGTSQKSNDKTVAEGPLSGISSTLEFDEIQTIISLADEAQRKSLLADEKVFATFVKNEAANKSVLAAAQANKVDQNERYQYIMNRAVENIIREIYLKQLIASKAPKDFPTEEQIQSYYNQNKDKFKLEERVHVWQIFLPFKDANDQKERELTKKQAESIINDLAKNTLEFAEAAEKYSNPPAGKYSGGYMGLVKVSDLKPEIRQPLINLAPDKISAPLQTTDGIHILKRGVLIPAQNLRYDEVKEQIRRILVRDLQTQLTQAVYKQASETYPVDIDDKKIEEWRLKLRTNLTSDKTATAK